MPNSSTVLAARPPGGPRHSSDHRHPLRSARPGMGAEGVRCPHAGVSAQPATPGAVSRRARAAEEPASRAGRSARAPKPGES